MANPAMPGVDIRPRLVEGVVQYFRAIGTGGEPPQPYLAGLFADVCAGLVGKERPAPLPARSDSVHLTVSNTGPAVPGGPIEPIPEAVTLLRAKGYKIIHPATAAVYTAFITNPRAQWTAPELTARVPTVSKSGIAQMLSQLATRGLIRRVAFGIYAMPEAGI